MTNRSKPSAHPPRAACEQAPPGNLVERMALAIEARLLVHFMDRSPPLPSASMSSPKPLRQLHARDIELEPLGSWSPGPDAPAPLRRRILIEDGRSRIAEMRLIFSSNTREKGQTRYRRKPCGCRHSARRRSASRSAVRPGMYRPGKPACVRKASSSSGGRSPRRSLRWAAECPIRPPGDPLASRSIEQSSTASCNRHRPVPLEHRLRRGRAALSVPIDRCEAEDLVLARGEKHLARIREVWR